MSYLDVDPEAVATAGRRTAATASTWEVWASRSDSVLRDCATEARDSTVSAAIEGYLSSLNPTLKALAKQVDTVGTNTVSAAHSVQNSDTEAAALLDQQGHHVDHLTSALRRPINY
jgi:hypothetical protein